MITRSVAWMKMPDPAAPLWPGVPGSALRTFQITLSSIWLVLRFISMWMAALTVRMSASTLPVMRQLALRLSSQMALAWRMWRMTLWRESLFLGAWNLGPRGLPGAFGVRPAAPLDKIVLDEGILGSHAGHALDAAVANRVAANDVTGAGLRSEEQTSELQSLRT